MPNSNSKITTTNACAYKKNKNIYFAEFEKIEKCANY
jgi:hypothetical protein